MALVANYPPYYIQAESITVYWYQKLETFLLIMDLGLEQFFLLFVPISVLCICRFTTSFKIMFYSLEKNKTAIAINLNKGIALNGKRLVFTTNIPLKLAEICC